MGDHTIAAPCTKAVAHRNGDRLLLADQHHQPLAGVCNLLLALDGKLAGKTHRLIVIDLYGACLLSWGSAVVRSRISRYRADAIIGFCVNYPARRLHIRLKVQRTLPTMWASWARHV